MATSVIAQCIWAYCIWSLSVLYKFLFICFCSVIRSNVTVFCLHFGNCYITVYVSYAASAVNFVLALLFLLYCLPFLRNIAFWQTFTINQIWIMFVLIFTSIHTVCIRFKATLASSGLLLLISIYTWPSVLRCRRSHGLEFVAWQH